MKETFIVALRIIIITFAVSVAIGIFLVVPQLFINLAL